MRIGDGDGPENYRCKKIYAVLASKDYTAHDFTYPHIHYIFCKEFNDSVQRLDLFETLDVVVIYGEYFHPLLRPTRHVGKVHLNVQDNISPVCAEWFTELMSMVTIRSLSALMG